MSNADQTYVDKMSVAEMKVASIHNDLEMLDYDIKQLEAESWRQINAGVSLGDVKDQFEARRHKLFEGFVTDLKYYLMHGTHRDSD